MLRPTWFSGPVWSIGWERVAELLERLREEPITAGLAPILPFHLLPDHKITAVADACQQSGRVPADADDSQIALAVMRTIVDLRPFSVGDPLRDPVVNMRAIFYAGAFIARDHHAEMCRTCPLVGRHCGGGVFCSRHTVERFFERRSGLNEPLRALAQLDDMREWDEEDFLRLVRMTTLSEAGCTHYTRSRVVKG